jgi:hypothetical protein
MLVSDITTIVMCQKSNKKINLCSCCDGEDTSRSENETRLVADEPPGWAAAGVSDVADVPVPGSLPRHQGLPGVSSMAVHALMCLTAMISSRCCLTWKVKA